MTTQPSDWAVAPKFGEWLRGIYASERNPYRDGMYVRTIRRTGRCNPGTYFELTDGKGNFWQYPRDSVIRLDRARELDASGAPSPNRGEMIVRLLVAGGFVSEEQAAQAAAIIDDLATPRAAEAGDVVKAVLDWQPLTHLNKGDRLYQILEAAGLPFDHQANSLRAAMGAVGAGGGS